MFVYVWNTQVCYIGLYFQSVKQRFWNISPENLGPPEAWGPWALAQFALWLVRPCSYALFTNPHFPHLRIHSFDLQVHKVSQMHNILGPAFN